LTEDDRNSLVDLRLDRLEEQAVNSRQTEREVDRLKIEVPRLESAVGEFRAEAKIRHDQLHASITRLHQRLDELAADEHREQGARAERQKLGRWGMAMIGAGTALGGLLVGIASLVIQNHP
jgi:hypothetical protein